MTSTPNPRDLKIPDIAELKGLTITGLNVSRGELVLRCESYAPLRVRGFRFYHNQDCCEDVHILAVEGNLADLFDEVLEATQESAENGGGYLATNRWPADWGPKPASVGYLESATRTVLTFRTKHGLVRVIWLGESNGYYSESVDMEELDLK